MAYVGLVRLRIGKQSTIGMSNRHVSATFQLTARGRCWRVIVILEWTSEQLARKDPTFATAVKGAGAMKPRHLSATAAKSSQADFPSSLH